MVLTVETASFVPGRNGDCTMAHRRSPQILLTLYFALLSRQANHSVRAMCCTAAFDRCRHAWVLKLDRTIVEVVKHEQRFGGQKELLKVGASNQ